MTNVDAGGNVVLSQIGTDGLVSDDVEVWFSLESYKKHFKASKIKENECGYEQMRAKLRSDIIGKETESMANFVMYAFLRTMATKSMPITLLKKPCWAVLANEDTEVEEFQSFPMSTSFQLFSAADVPPKNRSSVQMKFTAGDTAFVAVISPQMPTQDTACEF